MRKYILKRLTILSAVVLTLTLYSSSLRANSLDNNDILIFEIMDYCENYGIEFSSNPEFILEVHSILLERNSAINSKSTIKPTSGGSSPLMKPRFIPTSELADIIWTNNPVNPFNHVGIYTEKNQITEALEKGVSSRTVGKTMPEYPFEIYMVLEKVGGNTRFSNYQRGITAAWAKGKVHKGYDVNFANNKINSVEGDKLFNCSELVWKSWMYKWNVDLDSNGGLGVYPNNIRNSNRLKRIYVG